MPLRHLLQALVFACFVSAKLASAAPPALAPEPRLGNEIGEIAGSSLLIGHASMQLERGKASPLVIGDRTVGFFYRGSGSFEFTSGLSLEWAVMRHNLAKDGHVKPEETLLGLRIQDRIRQVLVVGAGYRLADFKTEIADPESPLAFDYGLLLGRFFGHHPSPLAQRLAHQALQGENKATVTLLIIGEKDNWYYHYDGVQGLVERLRLQGNRGSVAISKQPIGWNAKDPLGPDCTLTHVELSLRLDKQLGGALTVQETLVPVQSGMKALSLELETSDQFDLGGQGGYLLESVVDGKGRSLAFDHRAGEILVALADATQAEVPLTLTFTIANPMLERFSLSDYWELGVTPWFPMPALSGQHYTVKASMRVPDPYTPFMGGTTLRRNREGGFSELQVAIDRPVQFFTMHAGNYNMTEVKDGDLLIRVCSSKVLGGQEERLAKMTLQMIKGYETFLGPFPFREFNVIQRPVWGHGQAPPGLMMITSEAFNTIGDDISKAFSKGINQRVAHEIAHQYWGHVVKMPTLEEQWITESFAEYSSALMMLKTKGQGRGAYDNLVERWERRAKISGHIASIFTANQIGDLAMPFKAAEARTNLIYDKGALVLYRLHRDLGDSDFFRFLLTVQTGLNFKFGTTLDLIDALKAVAKKDFTPFFDDYIWGMALPTR